MCERVCGQPAGVAGASIYHCTRLGKLPGQAAPGSGGGGVPQQFISPLDGRGFRLAPGCCWRVCCCWRHGPKAALTTTSCTRCQQAKAPTRHSRRSVLGFGAASAQPLGRACGAACGTNWEEGGPAHRPSNPQMWAPPCELVDCSRGPGASSVFQACRHRALRGGLADASRRLFSAARRQSLGSSCEFSLSGQHGFVSS